ncbi:hypothetical protein D9619_001592 [Psilocybe cf. subviscida]|uniref:Uncharacterized protein n=1 Tax=Psilocybe cf. subviscida TaxID=2480587 RepID=A0A8H5BFA2_9AGAR|nr:hypothetical protein D9619_001592 [Psilocybe cf. subviscida]
MALGHDHAGHGQAHNLIAGDNIIVSGGNLTSIQNVYSGPPPNQKVLDILYPQAGPPRIDGRLLHNSNEYEDFLTRSSLSPDEVDLYSERILHELADQFANDPLHHESYHPFRGNHSRPIALSVAQRLAGSGTLLATIILPSSSQLCARYIVPTLAYQLAQNIPASAEHILAAIQDDPCVFERNADTQFKHLVAGPLKAASKHASFEEMATWPSIIIVDGNAHQFTPGSVPQSVIQLLSTLSANVDLPVKPSLVLTSSTTIVDKATRATVTLQQCIVACGNTAYYFTWRVHG